MIMAKQIEIDGMQVELAELISAWRDARLKHQSLKAAQADLREELREARELLERLADAIAAAGAEAPK